MAMSQPTIMFEVFVVVPQWQTFEDPAIQQAGVSIDGTILQI